VANALLLEIALRRHCAGDCEARGDAEAENVEIREHCVVADLFNGLIELENEDNSLLLGTTAFDMIVGMLNNEGTILS
jgi:hypothetical protein